jgi:hypothetical protein
LADEWSTSNCFVATSKQEAYLQMRSFVAATLDSTTLSSTVLLLLVTGCLGFSNYDFCNFVICSYLVRRILASNLTAILVKISNPL